MARKLLAVILLFAASALAQNGQATKVIYGSATPSTTIPGPAIFVVGNSALYTCVKTTCTSTDWIATTSVASANVILKSAGAAAAMVASSISDNGTVVAITEPIQVGTANCTVFGTAGGICMTEGTAPTNTSGAAAIYPDSTQHDFYGATAGSSNMSLFNRSLAAVNQTSKTATISISTLCGATAGACNVAGQYVLNYNFWGSGTACSSVTAGKVVLTFTWTDENGVSHAAIPAPILFDQKAAASNVTGTFSFNTTLATEGAYGSMPISSNGAAAIQFTATYTACTTGTGTYNLRLTATRLQ